jgi:FAD/FMN-containing dehydrogenase
MNELLKKLDKVLGPGGILTGQDVSNRSIGWGVSTGMTAKAIVRPNSTEQVVEVLKLCNEAQQAVVTQGGLTGLVNGSLTGEADIGLSLERMNAIEEIDAANRSMTVQAGVPLQTVQEAAEAAGLKYAVDLGARGSCTVGGNISTNAGGNQVIRYGMTRENVLGLEAVLADGTVISSMNKMLKNNAGYDLKQLFIGTEGTLGVVTRAVLRLRQQPSTRNTALVAVTNFEQVTHLLAMMDRELAGTLSAFEVMWQPFYDLIIHNGRHQQVLPDTYPFYVLIEACGADPVGDAERLTTILAEAADSGLVADAVLANSQAQRDTLWAIRDDIEGLYEIGPIFVFDVSLPIPAMEHYTQEVKKAFEKQWPEHRLLVFGHLGDGNLHLVAAVGSGDDDTRVKVESIIYGKLPAGSGCIAAEHGIGLDKIPHLGQSRQPAEIELMRTLKKTLDPHNILNPGKVIPPD